MHLFSRICISFLVNNALCQQMNNHYHNSQGNFDFTVLAHYMPWFEYPNGYHWPPTSGMYYTPIIGYYSSLNQTVIDWQLTLMKTVGINGVIVDWSGVQIKDDYIFIKNSTELMWNRIIAYNMTLGICYDMNSSPTRDIIIESMQYLNEKFFQNYSTTNYLHDINTQNPILLIWPSNKVNASLMNESFWLDISSNVINNTNLIYSIEYANPGWHGTDIKTGKNTPFGKFSWIEPQNSNFYNKTAQINEMKNDLLRYYNYQMYDIELKNNNSVVIGSIFKGFSDHYVAGGTNTTQPYNSIGFINADYGYINITMNYTFQNIFLNKSRDRDNFNYVGNQQSPYYILQIPTWNDYTEGTMIEPNFATKGCVYGCGNGNPYNDLLDIYFQICKYSNITQKYTRQEMQSKLQQITANMTD